MTDVQITRGEAYTHNVPGTYNQGLGRSESFPLVELHIGSELVGVEIHGEVYDPCKRCIVGGHYSFNGHDSICYACHGYSHGKSTTEADIVRRYVARQKAEARRIAKAEKAAKEAREAHAAWVAANEELAEALKAHRTPVDAEGYTDFSFRPVNSFLTKMADQAAYSPLTARQAEAAQDALDKLAERTKADREVGHWGTVGKRAVVEVKVHKVIVIEGQWGTSFLAIMSTPEGHALKSFSTGSFVTDALDAEGKDVTLTVKATVKEHGDYQGKPQTIVTRVATQS